MRALQRAIADPDPVPGLARVSPVAGLDRRSIGFFDVLAQSVAAVAPSAAVTTIPVLTFAVAGGATLPSLAIAAFITLLVASSINVFAKRIAAAGSLYTFVSRGLGIGASFMTGAAMLTGYGFISMFALFGAAHYLGVLMGGAWPGAVIPPWAAAILVVVLAAGYLIVLLGGIRLSTRLTLLIEAASVVAILVLIVILLAATGPDIPFDTISRMTVEPDATAAGVVIAMTAFVGFESASSLGVEAKRPFASVPRALVWTVAAAGALYLLGTLAQLAGFAYLGADLLSTDAPVNVLADGFDAPWIGILLDAIIAMSFFAAAVAATTALVRVLFSMARDGIIPSAFGRTSRGRKTPVIAILAVVPAIVVIPLVLMVVGFDIWQAMNLLLVCAASGYTVGYILVCVAAPLFLWRIGEITVWPTIRALTAAATLTVSLVIYLASMASGEQVIGVILFAAVMLAAGLWFFALRRRHGTLHRIDGVYDVPLSADVLGGAAPDTAAGQAAART